MNSQVVKNSGILLFGKIIALVVAAIALSNSLTTFYLLLKDGGEIAGYISLPISRLLLMTILFLSFFLGKTNSQLLLYSSIYVAAYLFLAVMVTFLISAYDGPFSIVRLVLGEPFREGFSPESLRIAFGLESWDSGLSGFVLRIFNLTSSLLFFSLITYIIITIYLLATKSTSSMSVTGTQYSKGNTSSEKQTPLSISNAQQLQSEIDDQARRLEQFGRLYKEGLLTEEEFEAKKREILGK